jgi:hypothetical protein
MSTDTNETTPTRFVEADGIRYAYRRFGRTGMVPLLFLEYFNSNMDGWDPVVTNGLAADHDSFCLTTQELVRRAETRHTRFRAWQDTALRSVMPSD